MRRERAAVAAACLSGATVASLLLGAVTAVTELVAIYWPVWLAVIVIVFAFAFVAREMPRARFRSLENLPHS